MKSSLSYRLCRGPLVILSLSLLHVTVLDAFSTVPLQKPSLFIDRHASTDNAASISLLATESKNEYGEESRKYRRTVYDSDAWVRHRDPERFLRNLRTFFQSGVVVQLKNEVSLVTACAIFITVFNTLFFDGVCDFSGNIHAPLLNIPASFKFALPVSPFSLSSSALGLVLVFRTNASYARWWEARTCWGKIINSSRNTMRLASSWGIEKGGVEAAEAKEAIANLATSVWLFPRSSTRHLSSAEEDEANYCKEVRERVSPDRAEAIIAARHRPNKALSYLSMDISKLKTSTFRRVEIDRSVVILNDMQGACERIFSAPVPLVYSRYTARFLSIWLLLLPLALYNEFGKTWNHVGMIPTAASLSFFFFGIEELAVQLEEPFSILPMHAMTAGIDLAAQEFSKWFADDLDSDKEP